MAGTKRKIGDGEIISKPELLYRINGMGSERDKALACFIYMSGCRISEILGQVKCIKHYLKEKNRYILDEDGKRTYEDTHSVEIPPLKKESIELMREKNVMLIHQVPCLKRRDSIPKRYIPIYLPLVKGFFEIFYNYYIKIPPGMPLFKMTRQRAWQILHDKLGLYNHFLIHERTTHLVVQEDFSDQDLKMFRGWSSTLPATSYVHMRWQDLARKQGADID